MLRATTLTLAVLCPFSQLANICLTFRAQFIHKKLYESFPNSPNWGVILSLSAQEGACRHLPSVISYSQSSLQRLASPVRSLKVGSEVAPHYLVKSGLWEGLGVDMGDITEVILRETHSENY